MNLQEIAIRMVQCPKGILAADESTGTMTKRLASIGVESTLENRNAFRDIIFKAPGLNQYISGVIMYDETFRNKDFIKHLLSQHILPGIKVDGGIKPIPGCKNETYTEGLDGLFERLKEYASLGATFTKWRAVITPIYPSDLSIQLNADSLAQYAALSQAAGLVPIVEPEVLMDGEHDIDHSCKVTYKVLSEVFYRLQKHNVDLTGIVLKPNMVLSGYSCPKQEDTYTVAKKTLCCMINAIPVSVPGIAFLSGGQPDEVATRNLNSINKIGHTAKMSMCNGRTQYHELPWRVTFSFGRGLQQAALKVWKGQKENREEAQQALLYHAKQNSLACKGELDE